MATKKKLRNIRDTISTRASSAYETAKDKVADKKDSTENFIKKRPFTSVGIAAGVGALIGAAIALGSYRAYENRRQISFWDRLTSWF